MKIYKPQNIIVRVTIEDQNTDTIMENTPLVTNLHLL